MPADIQATGYMGIAFEVTAGTYVAPTKFFPIRSESLHYIQETTWRRLIRGIADELGGLTGYSHVEGDIVMEVLPDVFPYFLYASRNTVVKAGTTPKTYTTTPTHGAQVASGRTLSITVVRNGAAFGYTGCVVGGIKCTNDGTALITTLNIFGFDEGSQSVPSATFSNQPPFGAGMYTIGVPTGSTVLDVDSFEFNSNDNPTNENRLATVTKPQFIRFGQREVTMAMTRDFLTRTEYDAFKTLAAQSIRVVAANGSNANFQLTLAAALKDTYEINGLSSQGDLVSAEMTWHGTYDTGSSKSYEFVIATTEDII